LEADPDQAGVNRALVRLLDWPEIARSPLLARFLSYIVERQLAGEGQNIKAYSIAVDVFGRSPDFDPQADPIVRVQARRLRSLLDEYYRGPGADDEIQIQLPIGRYVPHFVSREPPAAAARAEVASSPAAPEEEEAQFEAPTKAARGHVTVSWFVLVVLSLGVVALVYALSTMGQRQEREAALAAPFDLPAVRVMEFQNLVEDPTITPTLSALAVELVTDFGPMLTVDAFLGGRAGGDGAVERQADYMLSGVIRARPADMGRFEVSAVLTDLSSNSIVWNWSSLIGPEQLKSRGGIETLAQDVVLNLGGVRGPLHAQARDFVRRTDLAGRENFYLCGVLFVLYRTTPTVGLAERVRKCAEGLPEDAQRSGNVIAGLASLLAEGHGGDVGAVLLREDRLAMADERMAQALAADPTSSFVWEQRARLDEEMGQHEMAEAAYGTARQINPANIDAIASHARHLALIGRLDTAIVAAQRAIQAVPQTQIPDWYYCAPALAALDRGDLRNARTYAERCARVDTELGAVLALLVAVEQDEAAAMDRQLSRVLEVPSFRRNGIMSRMAERATDDDLLGRMEAGLSSAGVPEAAMYSGY